MIWTNESAGNLSVDYNFGAGAWAQERALLRISIANATSPQNVEIEWGEVASYTTDKDGRMIVDVSYVIRGEHSLGNTNGLMTISCGDDIVDLAFVINGLINPDNMLIPVSGKIAATEYLSEQVKITPPSVWLQPIFGLNDAVEVYVTGSVDEVRLSWTILQSSFEQVVSKQTVTSVEVPTGADLITLHNNTLSDSVVFLRKPLVCGITYAAVEWVGRSGAIKRHTFEVVKVTDNVNGATEFLTVDNSYHISKGQEQELTLRLEGLTRYDYWYYSDIVTSSDVRVAIHEHDIDFGNETRVAVTNTSAEQPDSDNKTLEITIKYRRYDEI